MGARLRLDARLDTSADGGTVVAKVTTLPIVPSSRRKDFALLVDDGTQCDFQGYAMVLGRHAPVSDLVTALPEGFDYLSDGDIVRLRTGTGAFQVLYRKNSVHNFLLLTEQCNSKCIMCSQPPRQIDDSYIAEEILRAIPLMDPSTGGITLTGGEPTLLKENFLEILYRFKNYLPYTKVNVLSNGRNFAYLKLAERTAAVGHRLVTICVPLYSDVDSLHDFVVQADGAFGQTVRGVLNLARVGVRIEVRVVLHKQTYQRLPQLAAFLARNLPFVSHVALMGLEPTGFTRANLLALWIDPLDYAKELQQAVEELTWAGIPVSLYNHPLCLLPQSLRGFARQSISDWKNVYFEECDRCAAKIQCGGFFQSAHLKRSDRISPLVSV